MERQTVLFDLDDTLVYCNKYFIQKIKAFASRLEEHFGQYGIKSKEIKEKQLEIDLIGVKEHGFQVDRFPQSFVDTYQYFSQATGRPTEASEEKELLDIGYSVYESEAEPYPHMQETLKTLKDQGHTLCLYTGGDRAVQLRKVKKAGLEAVFEDRIYVTEHKNKEFLDRLVRSQRWSKGTTWMIGNSARTDIVPALEVGLNVIYLPADQEWEYNIVDINVPPQGAFYTLESLKEVPSAVQSYLKQKRTG
jgi:putative hydrolase of the HAD superfamily